MKEKIKTALTNKYKNLGFGEKAIEGVLGYLEATVTAEDQIETAVNAVEGMLKAFQGEVDSRVTSAVQKAKTTPDPAKPEGPKVEPVQVPSDMPEWAKGLSALVQTLTSEVTSLKSGKTDDSRKTQLETVLKDAPATYKGTIMKAFDRMKFEKDDEFTSYLDELKTDLPAVIQDSANTSLNRQNRPITPTGGSDGKLATKEELDVAMSALKI